MQDKEVKFRAKVIRNRFSSDNFKIYVAHVNRAMYPKLQSNKNGEFILVGNLPNLIPDIEYDILAMPEINKNFGVQYKVNNIKRDKPTDYNSSRSFLEEVLTDIQAKVLLEVYPDIIDKIIKNELEDIDLSKTKGIKEKTFENIKSKVIENFCLIELVGVFGGLIDINIIKKLYGTYTSVDSIKKNLREDPYRCLCKLSRVGFKTADSILLNLEEQNKLNPDKFNFKFNYDLKHSVQRMKSCLNYILEENENNGNTLMELKTARTECGKLVPQCIDLFIQVIKESNEDLYINLENKTMARKDTYNTELYISEFAKDMTIKYTTSTPNVWNINTELYREAESMNMTDEQLSTLDMMCNNNIGILTAPAGSGKSASVKALINMLDENHKTYMLMTPTGASSKVLKDYTNRECGTVHRQLQFNPANGEDPWGLNKDKKIVEDVVIIDEFSMVDIFLFKHIVDAIDINKTKLLVVFDSHQLPSVACGNVAQDLLSSEKIPTVVLTKIFRYAEGGLMQVVTSIRNSEPFLPSDFKGTKIFGTKKDFIFCELEQSKILKQCLIIYNKLIKDEYDLQDIMVLTSQNKGDYGTKEINKAIQTLMQKGKDNKFVMRGDIKFYKDDKVIQVINNYKALTPTNEETNIFNGNTGTIIRVGYNEIDVAFDDCIISYTKEELNQIELGYCISIHKCLPQDTVLFTNKGILQLNKINNNARIGEFKEYEGDIQVYNGNYLETPSHFYNNGLAKCKEITTKKGFKIKATMEHGLDILDRDGNIVRKNIEDISLNDYLVINKNSNIYGDRNFTGLKEIKNLDVRSKQFKLPLKLDKTFSEFLGLMVGDGVITQHGIALGKRHIDVVERFNELVYSIFGYKGIVKKVNTSNMYKSEISSMHIMQICNQIKEITPHNKTIPQMILETSKENQCAFLRGIFEDGTVNIKNNKFDHIEVCNKDYETSKLIHLMLSNMGIISSLKLCKSTKGGIAFLNWRIYIYKEQARLFNKHIGFISEFKQERLQLCEVDSCVKNCSHVVYPNVSNKLKFMINKYNIELTQNKKEIDNDIRKCRITNITLTSFLDGIDYLKDTEEYRYLSFLLNNSFIDSIESIIETETDTYCLTMSETHKFVQNGFYGWNCQGSSAKQVVVIAPKSHTFMLNSNLLYVAPTRAKERCYMLGNISTINSAIKKKENFNRNTFLQEMLTEKQI